MHKSNRVALDAEYTFVPCTRRAAFSMGTGKSCVEMADDAQMARTSRIRGCLEQARRNIERALSSLDRLDSEDGGDDK